MNASLIASTSRPLPLRARTDLEISWQTYQGDRYCVLKDPLTLEYYRFQEEEYYLLSSLDGVRSIDELRYAFERRYPPQEIATAELTRFVGMLHQNGLVISATASQDEALLKRRKEKLRKQRLNTWVNPLSLRLNGIDPDRLLDSLLGPFGWLFSRAALLGTLLLALAAWLLVMVQFDTFCARLPHFRQFFALENWIAIAVTLAVTKVLHEFGHGLACKRFGGECHEMGVMFLVLTPCLYCNVSDSWMLSSKWQRAAIGAAGMYVELLLASLATFVWWFSEPGWVHYMALNVMFVCSVSTLLFNANPLLRFDGYYVLADLIEIPNLRQKASTILNRKMASWLLGLQGAADPFLPQRHQLFFALYTIAAAIYRWVVSAGILWFLYRVLEPYGLQVIGRMIGLMALYGLIFHPLWRLFRFFYVPGRIDQMNRRRASISMVAIVAGLLLLMLVPLPYYVYGTLQIQPQDATAVYVEVPGQIQLASATGGDWVAEGEPLLTLSNIDLQLTIARLEEERENVAARLDMLNRMALTNDQAATQLITVAETLATLEDQLARRRGDLERLQVTAPHGGHFFPPPKTTHDQPTDGRLPSWSGSPLDPQNQGARLAAGTLVGHIGHSQELQAIIAIEQGDVEFVTPGQIVELQLAQYPGQVFRCELNHVAGQRTLHLGEHLGGEVIGKSANGEAATERPVTYQASAPLAATDSSVFIGGTGQAKIHAGYRTLANRLWWFARRTFRLRS